MPTEKEKCLEYFQFKELHPDVSLGTASDRYVGWIGQIYSGESYAGRIRRRSKSVGGKNFVEEVLPVESVGEYFQHFRVLELDFTFYTPLLDPEGKATRNLHALRGYSRYLQSEDRIILKVPQCIFARKIRQRGVYVENDQYLDPEIFTTRFYEPALGQLAPWLGGFIFEQEYQRKHDRIPPGRLAQELDRFFDAVPKDHRYHVELRTDAYLTGPVFDVLEKHGVGQVLSHWTWLPPLSRQFALSHKRFLNGGRQAVIRLMTPRGMRYEDAYARAHPFNALVDGMMDPRMVDETVEIMETAINEGVQVNVIVNNRAGGNAPLIARQIARLFLRKRIG
ncbi:MAG: DUF72 domain-containing protein [Thermoplasmata archaeon]|nr:MAG: DUF72 domain-containing protein [Thermoplasmata archaeon]